jgi:5'(3')-deoxyribonucleotidase
VNDSFVLGVDLDGVCADHTTGFRAIVAERRGVDPNTLPLERSWDYEEWDLGPGELDDLHRHAVVERRMFRTLPMIDGAADSLWRLSDAGAWIRILTHRLVVNFNHSEAVSDTVLWLDDHRIPYRDLCFLGAKPQVEADLYLDDSPPHITALRRAGNQVLVFDQPYNRELKDPRAHGWSEVEDHVMERLIAHSGDYGVQPRLPGLSSGADRLTGPADRDTAVEA